MKAQQQSSQPFFARFLDNAQQKSEEPLVTTMKAGKCGNDCDTDSDVVPPTQQRPVDVAPPGKAKPPVVPSDEPLMTTLKAGKCGNDCDTDSDLRPGEFLA